MSRAIFLLLALILAAAPAWVPAPARADLMGDVLSVFEQKPEAAEDPYISVHDAFLAKAKDMEAQNNLPKALEYYKIAAAAAPPGNRETASVAITLKTRLDSMAEDLYASAGNLVQSDPDKARALLLRALLYNPELEKAVALMQTAFAHPVYQNYAVAQGDTLGSIARKVYSNPGAEFLITKINNISLATTLSPGMTLLLPNVAPDLSKPLETEIALAAPAKTPGKAQETAAPGAGAVAAPAQPAEALTQPAEAPAQPADTASLVAMAKLQFNQRLYDTVVSLTDEILAYEPANNDAQEMRRESYYQLALQLADQDNSLQAVKLFMRIPEDYKTTKRRLETLRAKLDKDSEPHYLAGVNYFINENLEKAVEEWEITLQMNPFHAKAKSDLEKARQLLETVKGLK